MQLISAKEAAERLGYHKVYVQLLLREGKLPGYKRGRWFIDLAELESFIKTGQLRKHPVTDNAA
jgi:excisionase family DNA binding protein